MQQFVHLHVHSQYSLLDGQADIKKLVDKAVKDGMPGMALTDHGNMFGIKEFANYAKKHNGKVDGKVKDLLSQAAEAEAAGDAAAAADLRAKAEEEKFNARQKAKRDAAKAERLAAEAAMAETAATEPEEVAVNE